MNETQSAIYNLQWSGKRVPPPQPPAWRAGALLVELLPGWPARSVSSRRPCAFRTHALPLSYRRSILRTKNREQILRPVSFASFVLCSLFLVTGTSGRIRTSSGRFWRPLLWPLSYARVLVELAGFEPAVTAFRRRDVGQATPQLDCWQPRRELNPRSRCERPAS
jgi:hypothetical protein